MSLSRPRTNAELFEYTKRAVLQGRSPSTTEEWVRIVNYWAWNIRPPLEYGKVNELCVYSECPLSTENVDKIVEYQTNLK